MSGSPRFKVYRYGKYVASCKYLEDAAALVAGHPHGQIKYDHGYTLWREGQEEFSAGESYDKVARICMGRLNEYQETTQIPGRRNRMNSQRNRMNSQNSQRPLEFPFPWTPICGQCGQYVQSCGECGREFCSNEHRDCDECSKEEAKTEEMISVEEK